MQSQPCPYRVSSWHSASPDKRFLRRPRPPTASGSTATTTGGGSSAQQQQQQSSSSSLKEPASANLLVDVYPQDVRQEEDKMSPDRLAKGYVLAAMPMEYDTMIKVCLRYFCAQMSTLICASRSSVA